MQRLKIFNSASCGDDLDQFGRLVEAWLVTEQPTVQLMGQSALDTHLILSVLYMEHGQDGESAAEAASVPDVFERTLDDAYLEPDDSFDSPLPEVELPY